MVEWYNVGNLYEFAGTNLILLGGTAREAGSLPYTDWIKTGTSNFNLLLRVVVLILVENAQVVNPVLGFSAGKMGLYCR